MTTDLAIDLAREAVLLALLISSPIMIVAVFVGLAISIFQAVTQLQDQTLSMVPKIVVMLMMLLYVMPWIINRMVLYTSELFQKIPSMFYQ